MLYIYEKALPTYSRYFTSKLWRGGGGGHGCSSVPNVSTVRAILKLRFRLCRSLVEVFKMASSDYIENAIASNVDESAVSALASSLENSISNPGVPGHPAGVPTGRILFTIRPLHTYPG